MNTFSKALILGLVIIASLFLVWHLIFPVTISNVYLDNESHFYFTLSNNMNEEVNLIYKWHLDDPKAGSPVYSGKGEIILTKKGITDIVESFSPTNDYDQRFFIMNIEIFKDGSKVGHYSKQKSPNDWNYTALPPVKNSMFP